MNEVTEELWQRGLRAGYMPEDLEKGYTIEKDEEKASGATFIKRIEVLEKFNSDEEAAKYAEEHDGVKIIRDKIFMVPKTHILGLITERIKLYREKIALKDSVADVHHSF